MHEARLFQPFTLHLAEGREIRLDRPEFLAQSPTGRTVSVGQTRRVRPAVTGHDGGSGVDDHPRRGAYGLASNGRLKRDSPSTMMAAVLSRMNRSSHGPM
jgi:hypothetical protein